MTTAPSHAGRFIWRELMSPDPAAVKPFYGTLFGWTSSEMDMGMPSPYIMYQSPNQDDPAAGCMKTPMADIPAHWLDYMTVDDVDASVKKLVALGGKAITEGMDIPGMGRFAIAEDPNGAVFAVFRGTEPGSTDTDRKPAVGTFCWSQMMTRDLAAAEAFYTALVGWTASPMGPGMTAFSRGDKVVATAMQMPPEAAMPDHWLSYVAVEDTDASAAQAEALGAKIFHKPQTMPGMGRFSVLADPQGAVFALWKDLSEAS